MTHPQIRTAARNLASLEIWLVGMCVAASIVSARFLLPALGMAAFFWLARWLAYGAPSVRTPADYAIVVLVFLLPVTLWVTALPEITQPQVYRLLAGIALYYALVNWSDSLARLRLLTLGLVVAGLLLALSSFVTVEWVPWSEARRISDSAVPFLPRGVYHHFPLLVSDTANPSVIAGNVMLLFPFGACLLLFAWQQLGWSYRGLAGVATLVCIVVLILTQSRGGLMTLLVVLMTMTILRWRWAWVIPILVTFVVIAALQFRTGESILAILFTRSSAMFEARIEIWSRAVAMIRDFPLTGIGMGTFLPLANQHYPFETEIFRYAAHHAHNLFLQVAVDLGLPGLLAWLVILVVVIRSVWHLYRSGQTAGDAWITGLGAALICSQVALMTNGMVDAVTWGMVRPAPIVWAIWGLAISGYRLYHVRS